MLNLGIFLILAVVAGTPAPSSSPAPSPPAQAADPCAGLLAVLNRPSIGYSPCAVKPGHSVSELGYSNSSTDGSGTVTVPNAFVRLGLSPKLELDAIAPGYARQRTGPGETSGLLDSGFGAKYEWWHDGSRAFATDFLYTVPSGSAAFTAGRPTETLNFDYTMPMSSLFSLSATLGVQSTYAPALSGNSARFVGFLPSLLITDQWNPRAQAYIEAYGQTRTRPDGGGLFGVDAAIQYLATPALEVDLEGGRTATDARREHYVGFGFGVRL